MLLSESTACYHRLIYYGRSNGSLDVDSSPLSGGNFSPEGLYNKNSHLRKYSAKDHAGKYQNALLSANAICKYVTEFSFVACWPRSFIPLFPRHSSLILLLSKNCDKYLTLCVIPRQIASFLYENLTIAYYLAHSSASSGKLLISFRLSDGKHQRMM